MSIDSAIFENTIFTFTLDGERLEKYLFATIMNEKILTCFITLLYIIDRERSYIAYLIIYLFLNVSLNYKVFDNDTFQYLI